MTLRDGRLSDAPAAASLHASQIREGFLSSLGPRFLTFLYRRVVRQPGSFLLVEEDAGAVVGFAAGAESVGRLYRDFILRDGLPVVLRSGPALVRSWRRVLETLRYGRGGHDELPAAELVSVAVAPTAQGRGVGRGLVTAALEEFERRGVRGVRVVAAADNAPALGLYQRCGFKPAARLEVHRGAASEVLTWP